MAKICPKCGKQNNINAKFCEDCGTSLSGIIGTSKYDQKEDQMTKPAGIVDQMKSWWNARDTKGKAVTGVAACCLGLIILVVIAGALSPDKNLISMELYGATYDSPGEYHVEINNSTTEYVVNGHVEPDTNLTVSSTDLNISPQRVNLTSNNTFQYKVKIPANVSEAKVRFDAVKSNKTYTYVELTIKRPSPQVSAPTATNTTPTTDTSNIASSSTPTASGIQVKVSYSGSWQGSYGDESGQQSVDGSGTKTFDMGSPNIVSAVFQKMNGGHGTLTVEIIEDGTVVESKSTSAAYGVVTVSHSFY